MTLMEYRNFKHSLKSLVNSWRYAGEHPTLNQHNPQYNAGYHDGILAVVRDMEVMFERHEELPLLESTGEATGR